MIDLKMAHTGNYLSQVYRQCLDRYGITKQQILSISGDNGKNVQKFIRIEQENSTEEHTNVANVKRRLNFTSKGTLQQPENEIDDEIEAVLCTNEMDDDISIKDDIFKECDIDLDVLSEHQIILDDAIQDINIQTEGLFNLTGINCAAHTIQLMIKDGLDALPNHVANVIKLCRRVGKVLRLNSTKHLAQEAGITYKMPCLEVPTRWGSMYKMVIL